MTEDDGCNYEIEIENGMILGPGTRGWTARYLRNLRREGIRVKRVSRTVNLSEIDQISMIRELEEE